MASNSFSRNPLKDIKSKIRQEYEQNMARQEAIRQKAREAKPSYQIPIIQEKLQSIISLLNSAAAEVRDSGAPGAAQAGTKLEEISSDLHNATMNLSSSLSSETS